MTDNSSLIFMSVGLAIVVIALLVVAFVLKSHRRLKSPKSNTPDSKLAHSLRDEKLKSDIIINSIEDGVVLIDSRQIIQHFNPGASKITGWPATEAKNLSCLSVIKLVNDKGVEYEQSRNPFNRIFKEGKTIRDNTATLVTRSNKQLPVNLSVTPLLDENQNVSAAVAVFRDVSQERKEEQQRIEFISTASHEMRTPVAAIEGYLALALNDKVSTIDSRAREYLNKAHLSTQGRSLNEPPDSGRTGRLSRATHPRFTLRRRKERFGHGIHCRRQSND
jgi:PAS domain S-box-containing protein